MILRDWLAYVPDEGVKIGHTEILVAWGPPGTAEREGRISIWTHRVAQDLFVTYRRRARGGRSARTPRDSAFSDFTNSGRCGVVNRICMRGDMCTNSILKLQLSSDAACPQ